MKLSAPVRCLLIGERAFMDGWISGIYKLTRNDIEVIFGLLKKNLTKAIE